MGLLFCRFPERNQPLNLAREFKEKMAPLVVDIDESDGFAGSIAKIESALDAAGQSKEMFRPLLSKKRNAEQYAPQYRIELRVDESPFMTGAVNRRTFSLTWDDPIPDGVLRKVLLFAKEIPAADVEAEDDAGNPISIEMAAHAST